MMISPVLISLICALYTVDVAGLFLQLDLLFERPTQHKLKQAPEFSWECLERIVQGWPWKRGKWWWIGTWGYILQFVVILIGASRLINVSEAFEASPRGWTTVLAATWVLFSHATSGLFTIGRDCKQVIDSFQRTNDINTSYRINTWTTLNKSKASHI